MAETWKLSHPSPKLWLRHGGCPTHPSIPKTIADMPTPKYSALQTACAYIFRFWTRLFCGYTTNQSTQNSVRGQFFYHSSCKNSVGTHIFNYTDHHDTRTTFFCLHLQQLFTLKDRKTFSLKALLLLHSPAISLGFTIFG